MRKWHTVLGASLLLLASPPSGAVNATLTITGDDSYDVYLNGALVGSQVQDGMWGWDVPDTWVLSLVEGANIIAVRGTDICCNSGMGLIAVVESSEGVLGATDGTWRVTDAEIPGWKTLAFDDSGWTPALDEGPFNATPWSLFAPPLSVFSASGARWIWRGAPPYSPGYGYYNPDGTYSACYFRKVITVDATVATLQQHWTAIKQLYK